MDITDLLIALFLFAVVVCAGSGAALLWMAVGRQVMRGWQDWRGENGSEPLR